MGDNKDALKESASIIKEIEKRLEEVISKKKEEIEKELEERIKQEKEEAEKKIEHIEKDFAEEKQALTNYHDKVREYEDSRVNLKNQIKYHIDKAVQFQKGIESLTAQTLEELKKVGELNQELEELYKGAKAKANILKKDLEEKFGVAAELLKTEEFKEIYLNLEQELEKLKKIKELLASPEAEKEELVEEEAAAKEERELKEEVSTKEAEAEKEEEGEAGGVEIEAKKEEERLGEKPDEMEEVEPPIPEEVEKREEEPLAKEEAEEVALKREPSLEDASKTLEDYRKSEATEDNGEIRYFQKNDRVILDGEGLMSGLDNSLDEAKKLYAKLPQTESPKDKFFIKQEIIRHQEALRKIILRSVRMCEEEACSLPVYTKDILNMDVLKEILEKLNMENWSNQDDFTFFEKYAKNIKNNYDTRITPPAHYLKSIMDELGIDR